MNLKRLISQWLAEYYAGKLEEVKQNRMYLIAQSRDTHRMLDEEEQRLIGKVGKFKESP